MFEFNEEDLSQEETIARRITRVEQQEASLKQEIARYEELPSDGQLSKIPGDTPTARLKQSRKTLAEVQFRLGYLRDHRREPTDAEWQEFMKEP